MISLFITDIDGCLMEPFTTPDWNLMGEIKALNARSREDDTVPPLTLCTGRPMPYAEAIAQWMDIRLPIVFESAGVFHLEDYSVSVNGTFDAEAEEQINELKQWLKRDIIANYQGMQAEFSKLMDAGLIHPDASVIQEVLPKIRAYIEEYHEGVEVHHTEVSINILVEGNNKRNGIEKLCDLQGITPEDAAYIGDSSGDIPGLERVGHPFAPDNAAIPVKQVAKVIPHRSTEAVLEAYREAIQLNRG